jgi:hypothetical protein
MVMNCDRVRNWKEVTVDPGMYFERLRKTMKILVYRTSCLPNINLDSKVSNVIVTLTCSVL